MAVPQQISNAQPERYGEDMLLEEEKSSWYSPQIIYPMQSGEIFQSSYQVLAMQGYGTVSTAWLCWDLKYNQSLLLDRFLAAYALTIAKARTNNVALKVCMTGHRQALNEVKVLKHLDSMQSDHPGSRLVRKMLDAFEIEGTLGPHVVSCMSP
jgi:hypothetical protein